MADTYGANKAARLRAERRARAEENTPPPLAPPYPWEVIPFDPLYFGAWYGIEGGEPFDTADE